MRFINRECLKALFLPSSDFSFGLYNEESDTFKSGTNNPGNNNHPSFAEGWLRSKWWKDNYEKWFMSGYPDDEGPDVGRNDTVCDFLLNGNTLGGNWASNSFDIPYNEKYKEWQVKINDIPSDYIIDVSTRNYVTVYIMVHANGCASGNSSQVNISDVKFKLYYKNASGDSVVDLTSFYLNFSNSNWTGVGTEVWNKSNTYIVYVGFAANNIGFGNPAIIQNIMRKLVPYIKTDVTFKVEEPQMHESATSQKQVYMFHVNSYDEIKKHLLDNSQLPQESLNYYLPPSADLQYAYAGIAYIPSDTEIPTSGLIDKDKWIGYTSTPIPSNFNDGSVCHPNFNLSNVCDIYKASDFETADLSKISKYGYWNFEPTINKWQFNKNLASFNLYVKSFDFIYLTLGQGMQSVSGAPSEWISKKQASSEYIPPLLNCQGFGIDISELSKDYPAILSGNAISLYTTPVSESINGYSYTGVQTNIYDKKVFSGIPLIQSNNITNEFLYKKNDNSEWTHVPASSFFGLPNKKVYCIDTLKQISTTAFPVKLAWIQEIPITAKDKSALTINENEPPTNPSGFIWNYLRDVPAGSLSGNLTYGGISFTYNDETKYVQPGCIRVSTLNRDGIDISSMSNQKFDDLNIADNQRVNYQYMTCIEIKTKAALDLLVNIGMRKLSFYINFLNAIINGKGPCYIKIPDINEYSPGGHHYVLAIPDILAYTTDGAITSAVYQYEYGEGLVNDNGTTSTTPGSLYVRNFIINGRAYGADYINDEVYNMPGTWLTNRFKSF